MATKIKLTYTQLREILALTVSSEAIRMKLEDMLKGKEVKMSEVGFIELIHQSNVDGEMIRILSGQDPDTVDAMDGVEIIADFFAYMKANKEKWQGWLSSIGYAPTVKKAKATASKNSK